MEAFDDARCRASTAPAPTTRPMAKAAAAGLHQTFIGFVERAETNISIDNIEKIAMALATAPAELLSSSWVLSGRIGAWFDWNSCREAAGRVLTTADIAANF
jgi:hypothetical protein